MKKALIGFMVAIFFVLAATQIDDPLNEDANQLLIGFELPKHSNAFYYLLGINANPEDDPIEIGKKVFSEHQKEAADAGYQPDYAFIEPGLVIPQGAMFCQFAKGACLASLFGAKVDSAVLLSEHRLLSQRVDKFLKYDDYSSLSEPSLREVFPPYEYIVAAARLRLLSYIQLVREEQTEEAINQLLVSVDDFRKMLVRQDTVIGKLVYSKIVSNHIDVLSVILNKHPELKPVSQLTMLTSEEKAIDKAMYRDFYQVYEMFKDMVERGEILETGVSYPGWYTRAVFKLNMTLNADAHKKVRAIELVQLSPAEFAHSIRGLDSEGAGSKIRNYIGSVLNQISDPLTEQVNHLVALDAKIALFNDLHLRNKSIETIKDPYHPDKQAIVLENRLCVDSPQRLGDDLACLALSSR